MPSPSLPGRGAHDMCRQRNRRRQLRLRRRDMTEAGSRGVANLGGRKLGRQRGGGFRGAW